MIDTIGAVLLISPDAPRLVAFYRDTLGVPFEEEIHEGAPPHYGCDLGPVHFAIHPKGRWSGVPTQDALSPVIALITKDAAAAARALIAAGVETPGPVDHGFALIVAFRDPDGNHVTVMQMTP